MQNFNTLTAAEVARVRELRERRPLLDLSDAEILELYDLEKRYTSRAYSKLVAALSVFPPYLDSRPQLINAFVAALYEGGKAVFAGVTSRDEFREFLLSKAQVDNDLETAYNNHRPEFEAAIDALNY